MPSWTARFASLVSRKVREAETAEIPGYRTTRSDASTSDLRRIGNGWTRALFDGPFYSSPIREGTLPAVSLVFVQSADGNTGTPRPLELGGGSTDKHLIYEGLSGASADAVLTGGLCGRGLDTDAFVRLFNGFVATAP